MAELSMLTPAYDLGASQMSFDCMDNILDGIHANADTLGSVPAIKFESSEPGALDVPEFSLGRGNGVYDDCVVPQQLDYASDTDGSVGVDDFATSPVAKSEVSQFDFLPVPGTPPISPREIDSSPSSFAQDEQECTALAHDIGFPTEKYLDYDISLPTNCGSVAVPRSSTFAAALTMTAGTLSEGENVYDLDQEYGWPGVSVTSDEQLQQLFIQQITSHFNNSNPSRRKSLQQDVCDYLQFASGEYRMGHVGMDFVSSSTTKNCKIDVNTSSRPPVASGDPRKTAGSNADTAGVAPPDHCKGTGEGGWDLTLLNMSTVELNRWLKTADLSKEQMCVLKTTRRRIKNRRYTQKSRARRAHDKHGLKV